MEEKRTRRTKEELVADLDKKIEYHKKLISDLELKKERILNPPPRKKSLSAKALLDFAKSSGMSLEELAEKIGYR